MIDRHLISDPIEVCRPPAGLPRSTPEMSSWRFERLADIQDPDRSGTRRVAAGPGAGLQRAAAGLVDRVLVGENDTVKSGQPLLRLISPELGELQLKLLEAASKSGFS